MKSNIEKISRELNDLLNEHRRKYPRTVLDRIFHHHLISSEGLGFLGMHVQADRKLKGKGIIHPRGRLENGYLVGDFYTVGLGEVEFSSLYYNMPKSDKYDFFSLYFFILDELRGCVQPKFIEGEQVNVRTLRDLSLRVSNKYGNKVAYSLNYELTNDII